MEVGFKKKKKSILSITKETYLRDFVATRKMFQPCRFFDPSHNKAINSMQTKEQLEVGGA
jgi:hypothetical protein